MEFSLTNRLQQVKGRRKLYQENVLSRRLEVAFYQWQLFRFVFVIYLVCIFFLGLKIHVNGMHVVAVGHDGSTILQNVHLCIMGLFSWDSIFFHFAGHFALREQYAGPLQGSLLGRGQWDLYQAVTIALSQSIRS